MRVDADVKNVDWDNCQIENWNYQWFLDPTHRAPQWTDLTPAYRQYWIWNMLPVDDDNRFYLAWINWEEGEYDRKIRQLTRWINEWNNMSQREKMGFFDPVIRTERARSLQPGAKLDMITPNPFKISEYAIDTAVLPGREERLHGQPQAVTGVHVGTELVYVGPRDDCPDHPVYPDLPPWKFQSGSRWWVKQMDSMPYSSMMSYELRNGDNTIFHCIQADDLLRFINGDVLRIVRRREL